MLLRLPTNIWKKYDVVRVWKSNGYTQNENASMATSKTKDFKVTTSKVGT